MNPSIRPVIRLLLAPLMLMAGCAVSDSSSPSARVWSEYLQSSPFSYPQNNDPDMVGMLAREIRSIPTEGATPEIQQHVRAVEEWAALYPEYRSRADAAGERVYKTEKRYEGIYGNTGVFAGAWLGGSSNRGLYGTIGNLLGIWINEVQSRSAADKAWAKVMAPSLEMALLLAQAEHSINFRQGRASTNHLRKLVGRY